MENKNWTKNKFELQQIHVYMDVVVNSLYFTHVVDMYCI